MSLMPSVTVRPIKTGRELVVRPISAGTIYMQITDARTAHTSATSLHLSPHETRTVAQEIVRANMAETDSFPHKGMNAREQLQAIQDMLSFSDETLSFGLRSPEDAARLWRAWSKHPEDAYPDTWEPAEFIAVLGYDPLRDALPAEHHTATEAE